LSGPVIAARGMVATSQKLATDVGVALLERGGSAVDAAIGANAMLSLCEPFMCGPGGDLFAIMWDPATRKLHGLNASGRSPRAQSLTELKTRLGGDQAIPVNGVHSITVPGAVRGWAALHERFGRLNLGDIFAPVIEYAAAGVKIGPATAAWWHKSASMAMSAPTRDEFKANLTKTFLLDGRPPNAGDTVRNPGLGRTYAGFADRGFDDFYEGDMAARMVAYLAGADCRLSAEDFAEARVEWVEPITTQYRGYDVYELPPNGQGLTVLQMLNILENFPVAEYGPESADYWHRFIEAKKLAFEDRARFYGDPDFGGVPIAALNDKAYAAERAALITDRALCRPAHGDPILSRGDTTYLSVADDAGLMVSLIQSIYVGFGSGLVPDGMGFAFQSRGSAFSLDAEHPNAYAPGKRPFHTIIPAFVMHAGEPLMSVGVMGADMQPQGQVQVLVNMLDFDMDPDTAGRAPRMRHDGLNTPTVTRQADAGQVFYEAAFEPGLIGDMKSRGHEMSIGSDAVDHFMGGYQCVRRIKSGYSGASEPRFDGYARGRD